MMRIGSPVIDGVFRIGFPSECILEFASGFPQRIRVAPLLFMALAFIDESKEPPVFVVAGFVAPAPQWALFADEWDSILHLPMPRPIKYLKMREAMALVGEFAGCSVAARDARLKLFHDLINRVVDYGVSVFIHAITYEQAIKGKMSITFDHPYFAGATHVITSIIQAERERGRLKKIDFIFDEERGQEPEVTRFLKIMKERLPALHRKRMGSPQWRDDIDVMPLQAADILAWTARKIAIEKLGTTTDDLFAGFRESPFKNVPIKCSVLLSPILAETADEFKKTHNVIYETGQMRSRRNKNP